MSNQFVKLCDAEKFAVKAMRDASWWVDNQNVRESLKRAEYLLMEVRHAALTLCDEKATTHEKNEAITRLEYSITHAGQEK